MVVKINPAAPSCGAGVGYNERKVAEGVASVIFSSNIEDIRDPMKTFSRYEKASIRTKNMGFHASVNPSETDNMSDAKVTEFIKDYMKEMGYGDQPYIIYKHEDTGRIHYHIVSVRVK